LNSRNGIAIAEAIEPLEKEAAKERSSNRTDLQPVENFSAGYGRALDKVAAARIPQFPTIGRLTQR